MKQVLVDIVLLLTACVPQNVQPKMPRLLSAETKLQTLRIYLLATVLNWIQ
jgi:hypothetical protein